MSIKTNSPIFFLILGASLLVLLTSCTKDNKEDVFGICEPENISFSDDIIPIFETKCTSCHGGADPKGGIDLKVYSEVKDLVDDGKLMPSITKQGEFPMPPSAGNSLSECHIETIKTWINEGIKDN